MRVLISICILLASAPLAAFEEDRCGNSYAGRFYENTQLQPSTPSADFELVENEPGVVRHKKTGLIWSRCFAGQTWNDETGSCSGEPLNVDPALPFLAGDLGGWRIPSANEARTIIERCKRRPALNTVVFPFSTEITDDLYMVTSTPYRLSSYAVDVSWVGINLVTGFEAAVDILEGGRYLRHGIVRLVRDPE